ncbi:MAG: transposase, partial [Chlamydiia bacterium]|nr:transposase [Chlamydiia bacterium]
IYAISSTINLKRGFDEDDLYTNLSWLSAEQSKIEDRIFFTNQKQVPPSLFLYDVTSSYLEGEHNELAEWGYNRDKKKGKQQIVIGLLTSDDGTPITTEVFKGNTQDPASLQSQIQKCKERFHCQHVTFVGDRGMIKSGQIKQLEKHGFHYITAITKVQIQTLIKKNILQYNLFDDQLLEIEDDGIRYIIRRNPVRAEELSKTRSNKQTSIEKLVITQNTYLATHPRAKVYSGGFSLRRFLKIA